MAGFMYNLGVVFQGKNRTSPALNKMTKDAAEATVAMQRLSRNIHMAVGRMPRLGMGLGGIALGGGALYGVQAGIRGIVSEASRFETANVQFTNLLGSAELAASKLREMRDFAAKTPFEFKYTQELSKQMLAAGVGAEALLPTMRMLGDLGMGNVEKITQLSDAYTKVKMVGRATWRELRMFATAGVPIFEELQKVIGTNQLGLERMSRQGKISFELLQKALESLSGPGSKFNGMMMAMMDTQGGLWSNFRENLDKIAQDLGSLASGGLKTVELSLINLTNRTLQWIEKNKELIQSGFDKFLKDVALFIMNIDVARMLNFLKGMIKFSRTLLTTLIGYSVLRGVIIGISSAFQILANAAAVTGTTMSIAFFPFLGIMLAITAGVLLLAWAIGLLMKKLTGKSLTENIMNKLPGYDEMFKAEMGSSPVSLENQNAVRSTEQTYTRNNNSTATLNIATAPGTVATLDRDVPGVSIVDYSLGNQLARA